MGKKRSARADWGHTQQALGAEARAEAIRRLQELHSAEYDALHKTARLQRGLPAEVGLNGHKRLRAENEALRQRLAELENARKEQGE